LRPNIIGTREKASRELLKVGPSAEPALRNALAGGLSLEAHLRVRQALRVIEGQHPERLRAVEILERLRTDEARELLVGLARGATGARLTQAAKAALERLGRR